MAGRWYTEMSGMREMLDHFRAQEATTEDRPEPRGRAEKPRRQDHSWPPLATDTAWPRAGGAVWTRWSCESRDEFHARVLEEARRLGLLPVKFVERD